jgi:hypothetical protein
MKKIVLLIAIVISFPGLSISQSTVQIAPGVTVSSGISWPSPVKDQGGQVYNFLAYGGTSDAKVDSGNCAITTATATLTCSDGPFAAGDVNKAIVVNKAGAASADLTTTISAFVSATQVTLAANAGTTVASGGTVTWGTDNTTAINNLDQTVFNAGGGVVLWKGSFLITGQVSLPNNGASPATQPGLRWQGLMHSANGLWSTLPASPSTIIDTYQGGGAKIQTTGLGVWEVDHLLIKDTGTDCTNQFFYTTGTQLNFHDNAISGTASGSSACQTVVYMDSAFSGFGSYVEHNFFDRIQTAVKFNGANDNSVVVAYNEVSKTCGDSAFNSQGAFTVNGGIGDIFRENIVEDTNYVNAPAFFVSHGTSPDVTLQGGAFFIGNSCWDAGPNSYCYDVDNRDIVIIAHADEMGSHPNHLFFDGTVTNFTQSDVPANVIFSGLTNAQTVTGSTAGNFTWSMPVTTYMYKKLAINFTGYQSTAKTFSPVIPFSTAVNVGSGCPAGLTVTLGSFHAPAVVNVPDTTAAAFTGYCIVEGQ